MLSEQNTFKVNRTALTIIHCLIPITIGGLIYVFFRSTELRMFEWFSFFELDQFFLSLRTNLIAVKDQLPSWIFYSIPDGLWTYSFTSALIIFWNNDQRLLKFWLWIPFTSGILLEIAQGFKLFPGTFDFLDLIFSLIGLIVSKIIINNKFKQNDKYVS